jgi:CubicO group peptidase (beta-lactamase class C family)
MISGFEEKALSKRDFAATWNLIEDAIKSEVAPAMAFGIWTERAPHTVFLGASGVKDPKSVTASNPQLCTVDTFFDLASLTKVISPASIWASAVCRGLVSWDMPVKELLPEFKDSRVRVSHLLSHTSGLPAWAPFHETIRGECTLDPIWGVDLSVRRAGMRELVLNVKVEADPGSRTLYSDVGILVLGYVIEEFFGMSLDQVYTRSVSDPMGLPDLRYHRVDHPPGISSIENVAVTEIDATRGGVIRGQVHDDNTWAMGGVAPHAGLFGRVGDVVRFGAQWLNGFVDRKTRDQAWGKMARPLDCSRTLGWDTPSGDAPAAGSHMSARTVGHLGFTGTSLWIDPAQGLVVSLLTNRVHPSRSNESIKRFRPQFHDQLILELGKVASF